ncbi:hypothetical protein TNCV_3334301 [Trichonephila clavipes]|nr:hypothetical protein TNCV_3334301 [Trichonephila clavipes]
MVIDQEGLFIDYPIPSHLISNFIAVVPGTFVLVLRGMNGNVFRDESPFELRSDNLQKYIWKHPRKQSIGTGIRHISQQAEVWDDISLDSWILSSSYHF